ncbi:hypothetical protein LJR219_003733 [Phenylobacterium sp. LjRoot219]|uniref:hypothetical protein n=1 Tax=Phenylobacterium sp. LjRoot219 TaxID=3342283 RepID=UPI003ECEE2B1
MPAFVATEDQIQAAADAVRKAEQALNTAISAAASLGILVDAGATELQTIHGPIPRVHVKLTRAS